jgi:hypothetical protein
MDFITQNWELLVTVLFVVLAFVLTGKRKAWFSWFNEAIFFAFDSAEKKGLLEGIKGADKLRHFLTVYRDQYTKRFGTEPTSNQLAEAAAKANELSIKEKVIRLSSPNS